ncbi:uncharacterized protein LOC134266877 isoform X2 [Saccostrea cucullata]|uniref:uncharacterized protein LOC134266877 isoform X2 n=1 Tax=Saccostrea cuccullata TaxID=36930 RepID=UPI002ED29471
MEISKSYANEFAKMLQACDKQKKYIFYEIMESLNTFIEEVLLSRHIILGANDTINVEELLYKDFHQLFHFLKIGTEAHAMEYLDNLKTMKENRLKDVLKRWAMFRSNTQVTVEQIIDVEMTDQEREDTNESLALATNILRGVMSYVDEVFEVDEINKRNLGKMIIRYVGHEGTEAKPGLRKILQACIDFLQKEAAGVWKNASFTIYDEDDNMYSIASGNKKYRFICGIEDGKPFIKEEMGGPSRKKPKILPIQHTAGTGTEENRCHIM